MESSTVIRHIRRKFGYCIVNWEIKNYGFSAHGMEYEIKSEPFSVRPHMTKWRMALKSEFGLCNDTEIRFHLERMDDEGPDTVSVNMNISLCDQEGKEWKTPSHLYCIKRNDGKEIFVPNIYFGRVNVGLYNFYSMTLLCQMFVYEATANNNWQRDESLDYGLTCLSRDIEKLYTSKEFADVSLGLSSKQMNAHRAVLSARSETFKNLFIRDARNLLRFPYCDWNEVSDVLRYVYSGEVSNILEKPTDSIADCVFKLSLQGLEDHFMADEQKLKTEIHVHQTGFTWKIENFSERNEECIQSRVINGDMVEMAWQLRLYPKGIGGKEDYLTVIAENNEGKIEGDVWAKIEVFHDSYDRFWKTMKAVKKGELFELRNFESRNSVLKKLDNGTLRLCFKVCASTKKTNSSYVHQVYPVPDFPNDYYYKKLSEDIFSLRGDPRFSDIIVYADGKEFKAHRCILSARSDKFHNLSDDLNEDKVVCIDDVKSDIVEIILDYIYSGVFQTFDFDKLLEVYDGAWKMGVNSLVSECSSVLQNSINEIKIFELVTAAYLVGDELLQHQCLRFLSRSVTIRDEILKKLESESPTSSTKVKDHLEKFLLQ